MTYDPHRRRLLLLDREGFFGLRDRRWTELWDARMPGELPLLGEGSLFVHPESGEIISFWERSGTQVMSWDSTRSNEAEWVGAHGGAFSRSVNARQRRIIPSLGSGGWVVVTPSADRPVDSASPGKTREYPRAWTLQIEAREN